MSAAPATLGAVEARMAEILRRLNGDGLDRFIRQVSPHLPPPSHIAPLMALVERARHERIRACISWPPRHAKTETLMHGLSWWLRQTPADTCGYITFSDTRARGKSRVIRERALQGGVKLSTATANLGEWRTTTGGGLVAVGVGGGITGLGLSGLVVVDDPFKNLQEAQSPLRRETIWDWFNEVVFTRLEGASIIVVHTRWHEDDLIGRLAQSGRWEVHNFPAMAEEDDPLGREPGEALWPEVFPEAELSAIREQVGEFGWAALYQGQPRPRGAHVFNEPQRWAGSDLRSLLHGCRVVIGVDPAASEKTSADYSAAVVLAMRGLGEKQEGFVLEVYRRQVTIPQLVADLRAMQKRWWGALLAVESVGGFKAVPQMLRAVDPHLRVLEIKPAGDKFTRAQAAAAAWNAGRLRVPAEDHPWLNPFLQETAVFTGTGDKHDDQVDALSHAWNSVALLPALPQRGAVHDPSRYTR